MSEKLSERVRVAGLLWLAPLIADLETALAVAQEQAAWGERLREAVQARPPALSATAWRTWANMARAMPWPGLVECCEAIAAALEAEQEEAEKEPDCEEDGVRLKQFLRLVRAHGLNVRDLASAIVRHGKELHREAVAFEAEQEIGVDPAAPEGSQAVTMLVGPEPPCPHEEAEWREAEAAVHPSLLGLAEGWWLGDRFFGDGEGLEVCLYCHGSLPLKPARFLTIEEAKERLPGVYSVRETQRGTLAGEAQLSDGKNWSACPESDSLRDLYRLLVAAVEEAEDAD